jgi:hypothetical protein
MSIGVQFVQGSKAGIPERILSVYLGRVKREWDEGRDEARD